MQVSVRIFWHVIVEDDVDSLDIHTTSKEIRSDKDSLLEILELLVAGQAIFLGHPTVNSDSREILLNEQLGECHTSLY